jgi:hypothetical protein
MNRLPSEVYRYLDEHPRHVAVPHRLMTYPLDVSSLHHAVAKFSSSLSSVVAHLSKCRSGIRVRYIRWLINPSYIFINLSITIYIL